MLVLYTNVYLSVDIKHFHCNDKYIGRINKFNNNLDISKV